MKNMALMTLLLSSSYLLAGPAYQMNKAFMALSGLIPYLTSEEKFKEKKNEAEVIKRMTELQTAFKMAGHDAALKEDLFAPSYSVVTTNLKDGLDAFKKGQKDYAHWRMKEITSNCIDCHSRLPQNFASSFQTGELTLDEKTYNDPYNLGIAYLIVRRYPDAKANFLRNIQESYIKKEFTNLELPFKQILLLDLKILRTPGEFKSTVKLYAEKKETPENVRQMLNAWMERLSYWEKKNNYKEGLASEAALDSFLKTEMQNIKSRPSYSDAAEVDLLMATGLLSQYLFQNPQSPKAADINYWLGWSEKRLQREHFFGSGDLFLKQCMRRYPSHPAAKECFNEYKESVEFEFTGSGGTQIPVEVQKELESFRRLLK